MSQRRSAFFFSVLILLVWTTRVQPQRNENFHTTDGYGMAKVLKKVQNSVVSIRTFISEGERRCCRIGSGFVYDEKGFIVTCKSVVQGGDSIVVTLVDGRYSPAQVVYYDESMEVALLKLPLSNLSPISWGETSGLVPRSQLIIFGNSLGVFPSVTLGTYLGRRANGTLRLRVVVPPGNCGSPVLDGSGRVVGLMVGRELGEGFGMGGDGMGVVLPIESVRFVVDDVCRGIGQGRGWVGLTVVDFMEDSLGSGVRVVGIAPGGPAEKARICKGDTIIGFDGQSIRNAKQLAEWVREMSPDNTVVFTIRKGRREVFRHIRVGGMPWTRR